MRYRRHYVAGGCYFFTVVTARRRPLFADANHVDLLRAAIRAVRTRHPFEIEAVVVLPDHLHTIWTLPDNDTDYSRRWRLIKTYVSKHIDCPKPLWQPRFWEHTIQNADDFARHMDYVHYNPVKHGLCARVGDWPYSSFKQCVRKGLYVPDWGRVQSETPEYVGHE